MTQTDPLARLEESVHRMDAEDRAAKAIKAARIKMVLGRDAKSVFFATLALRLQAEPAWEYETLATDGKRLVYNPDFVLSLTDDERVGVVAHEVLHCAMGHQARRGHREADRWNIACDLALNNLITDAGYKLPACAIFPGKGEYHKMPAGKGAEEYYSLLSPPEQEQDPQGEPGDQPGDGKGEGEGDPSPDPGGCGGVQDPKGGDPAAVKESQAEWEVATAQAHQAAKQRGAMPGGLSRMVEQMLAPSVPWQDVLREFVSRHAKNDYCVAPETLVLTSDLRWVQAGSLTEGDSLVGVDEVLISPRQHRRICETKVEAAYPFASRRLRILTDGCPPIVVTHEHQFLRCRHGHQKWMRADQLRVGDPVKVLVPPWSQDLSDSWLAGMFDGEGMLTMNKTGKPRACLNLRVAQNAGPVLERVKGELSGYALKNTLPRTSHIGNHVCHNVTIARISDVFWLLGVYRPTRLLPKLQMAIRERRLCLPRSSVATVTGIEDADEGEVIAIRTSSRTLVTNGLISHNSWSPPNRRFIHQGLYLPGMRSEELGDLTVAVDTSGSIGQKELAVFASELQGILDGFDVNLRIIYHDAEVQHVQRWKTSDGPLVLEPKGGGGTDHCPVFRYVEEHGDPPVCLVALTDLCSRFPDRAPEYPVLWCSTMERAEGPFGQTVYVKV